MADDGGVARAFGHFDGLEGFGQRADLVDFDEDGVANAFFDAFFQDFGIGHEQVVTHQLHFFAEFFGQQFPAVPVAFGHAVFNADDGIFFAPGGQHVGPLGAAEFQAAFTSQHVLAVFVELAAGAVQAQHHVLPRGIARILNGLQNKLNGCLVVVHIGGKATFIAHGHAHAFVVNDFLERMEHFRAIAQRLAERRCAHRDDHELLQVQIVVGVRAAVDDVHHGHGQIFACHAAEIAVQRNARLFCRRASHRHTHRQHRVGAQAAFILGAIQVDQGAIQKSLLAGIQPQHGFGNFGVDVLHRLQYALAQITAFVAVAQLNRLTAAGRCAAGHCGTPHHAAFEQHIAFNSGVAAAVEHFTANNINNGTHGGLPFQIKWLSKKSCRPRPARRRFL